MIPAGKPEPQGGFAESSAIIRAGDGPVAVFSSIGKITRDAFEMLKEDAAYSRSLRTVEVHAELAVVGGGMAGICCAVTAARAGISVVLIQDRPVLGGNASSEVRLWTLGATSHMYSPQRWAREGGVIDEILVENLYRNPEGNALLFDALLLEKVVSEPSITLLLNTAVFEAEKNAPDTISSVRAFCSQNSTMYMVHAPLFCDASGDGVLGFLSGAAFRMGAERSEEFGEKFAPTQDYGELLGHSLYFYSKDAGRPVAYVAPAFALGDIEKIPRFRHFNTKEHGCRLWWIEYGGRLDTVHDTETIKWELWKVVYGVWDYIKNSGKFPDARNLTLEWVGHIPGKRESRRFEGDYMLRQQDVIEQQEHHDAVAFGGWALDLHPADGVFSEKPGCTHWRTRGVYQIPYRCLYSKNIANLFLAGRVISVSHVAFGSTRVMATLAHAAQAVGSAAALCRRHGLLPRELAGRDLIGDLQRELLRAGQHLPRIPLRDRDDLARQAVISSSSRFTLAEFADGGPTVPLDRSRAQVIPLSPGAVPDVTFIVDADRATTLHMELRVSLCADNHTPDRTLAAVAVELPSGKDLSVTASFDAVIDEPCYGFFCMMENEHIHAHMSETRVTGLLSVSHAQTQAPGEDIGVESFEIWCPSRRPGGQNFAMTINPPIDVFAPTNVVNGWQRPTCAPNAWLASPDDPHPALSLTWEATQRIGRVVLAFDTDYDHPMESVLMGHPERAMPFCVKHYRITDAEGHLVAECADNHQSRNEIVLDAPLVTDALHIALMENHSQPNHGTPLALMEIRCYAPADSA